MPMMFSPVCRPVTAIAVVVPGEDRLKDRIRFALVTANESLAVDDAGGGVEEFPFPPPPPPHAARNIEPKISPADRSAFRCMYIVSSAVLGIAYGLGTDTDMVRMRDVERFQFNAVAACDFGVSLTSREELIVCVRGDSIQRLGGRAG